MENSMSEEHVREEQLREAACVGDVDALKKLIQHGVNVNSKNIINGWSALHWGCKRGRLEAVRVLLEAGADITANNNVGQVPAQLTKNAHILQLMGVEAPEEDATPPEPPPGGPTFTPSYIQYPAMSVDLAPSRLPNGDSGAAGEPTPPPSNGYSANQPAAESWTAPPSKWRRPRLKGAIPDDELVLKVRVAGDPHDQDFIELELPTSDLTYDRLLRECCQELNINGQVIERVRKLPNTVIRRDRDVQRLQDFQEIELVLRGGGRPAGADRPAGPFTRPIVY